MLIRSPLLISLVVLLSACSQSADHRFDSNGNLISARCVGVDGIEISLPDTKFESYALDKDAYDCELTVTEVEGGYQAQNGRLIANISANKPIAFFYDGTLLLTELNGLNEKQSSEQNTHLEASFKLAQDELVMGAGSRVLPPNLRGQSLPLYNRAHYGYGEHSKQMYYSMPLVYSSKGYYLIFDNAGAGQLDIDVDHSQQLLFRSKGGRASYVVIGGDSWASRVQNLTTATGKQPMPPRWALGSFASRFGYRDQAQVEQTAALYNQYDIGLDALVVDLYWFGPDIKGHMGNLQFDANSFANPKGMVDTLAQQGVNTVLITEPFVLTSSKRYNEAKQAMALATDGAGQPKTFDFYFGNTALIDVFSDSGQRWFKGIYQELDQYGIAGWWGDLGEPEVHPDDTQHAAGSALDVHNAYGHQWAKLVYQNALTMHPNTRPFVMMRSGFVGSQRYGMIPWSGDVGRNWAGLAAQPQIMLSMGMQGIAYMHSDLGGFTPTDKLDAELYTRWLQYGVFTPVFRPHAEESVASEPVYHGPDVRQLAKQAINLRYALMPYLYHTVYQNHTTGMPLARPMAMMFDEFGFEVTDQYMWGDSLLVAPVLTAGLQHRDVQLPAGRWYNLHSGQPQQGGQTLSVSLNPTQIPVYVKAGALVPTATGFKNLSEYDNKTLTLNYYMHPDTDHAIEGQLYDDDGTLNAVAKTINYRISQSDGQVVVELSGHSAPIAIKVVGEQGVTTGIVDDSGRLVLATGTDAEIDTDTDAKKDEDTRQRVHVYQMLPRVFANHNTHNKPWGTIEENGSGKFNQITDQALAAIKKMGTTHVWYTGVAHHALATDYQQYGISLDDPDVIKGRAGSPYAVKDYYNVNPDLADDVTNRLGEFEALIDRTHQAGMKVIIDVVPNHVARNYEAATAPSEQYKMGAADDSTQAYARDNNFYYLPGQDFAVPVWQQGYAPLNGDAHPLVDGRFDERPAKVTGNGAAKAQPHFNDWYETVKVNYGVRPDGSFDFARLPASVDVNDCAAISQFWATQRVPNSWYQFERIAHYWLDKGVDGFRYDMAEMVPVEFWSFLNCSIKLRQPDAFLLAEVYQPPLYDAYIRPGHMSALYDKVGFYDSLKGLMRGELSAEAVYQAFNEQAGREPYMLHFLENHDEQRIADEGFAGDAQKGRPAAVVSALIGTAPNMTYFGQTLGEAAAEDAGFGTASRTTIFDYWGLESIARWRGADGTYQCNQCSDSERQLQQFYTQLMTMAAQPEFSKGQFRAIAAATLPSHVMVFERSEQGKRVLVLANFAEQSVELALPLQVSQIVGEPLFGEAVISPAGTILLPALGYWVVELKQSSE